MIKYSGPQRRKVTVYLLTLSKTFKCSSAMIKSVNDSNLCRTGQYTMKTERFIKLPCNDLQC